MAEERPKHWHEKSQSAVFPGGYPEEELMDLPDSFWDQIDFDEKVRSIKAKAAAEIEALDFPVFKQLNAIREGNTDDPRFAQIDAIRQRSNDEEETLK